MHIIKCLDELLWPKIIPHKFQTNSPDIRHINGESSKTTNRTKEIHWNKKHYDSDVLIKTWG